MPFSAYFAAQCKQHKNWGSRDRKIYRQACYSYFRLGYATGDSIINALQLAHQPVNEILSQIRPEEIYPYTNLLSKQINHKNWIEQLMIQHPVYIMPVLKHQDKIQNWLIEKGIPLEMVEGSIKVPADTDCKPVLENGWGWIMDLSSADAASNIALQSGSAVWDCCSGAGGKALYVTNRYNNTIALTCSDKRFSVLQNLKERFTTCGLPVPAIELSDLTEPFQLKTKFDVIIADVPCSGSGTWGRTPENITTTAPGKVEFYAGLQRNIVKNILKNLKPGGTLYYITCSVFEKENESNTAFFETNHQLIIENQQYIHHAEHVSDWLFLSKLISKNN